MRSFHLTFLAAAALGFATQPHAQSARSAGGDFVLQSDGPGSVPAANEGARAVGATAVTTLRIDTRNTGVDLGLTRNADGTVVPKLPGATAARTPALGNADAGTHGSGATAAAPATTGAAATAALGAANDATFQGRPGTSTLGNPSSAGRDNGNSGTDNGRSTPGVSGGTGIGNSGTSGNGLATSAGSAPGNTGAGAAAPGNTGAGRAASGTTGAANGSGGAAFAGSTSPDAATAAEAASNSRAVPDNGTGVSGRILTGGTPGGASRGMR